MTTIQVIITLAIVAAMTLLTRALPFLLFPAHRETPPLVTYLGKVLPYAMIGMLVVYCLKDASVSAPPFGLPEAIGVLAVGGLYCWRKNTLVAIGVGTLIYMILVQIVFV